MTSTAPSITAEISEKDVTFLCGFSGRCQRDGRHGTAFGVAGVIEPFAAAIDFPPDPDDDGLGVTLTSTVFRAVISAC